MPSPFCVPIQFMKNSVRQMNHEDAQSSGRRLRKGERVSNPKNQPQPAKVFRVQIIRNRHRGWHSHMSESSHVP